MDWNIETFLKKVYLAKQDEKAVERIAQLIKELPTPPDVEQTLSELNDVVWQKIVNQERTQKRHNRRLEKFLIYFLLSILIIGVGGFLIYKLAGWLTSKSPQEAPIAFDLPVISSPTFTLTPTITPLLTSTITPTPVPPSGFLVPDPATVLPSIPVLAEQVWILDAVQAVVDPALSDTAVWEQIQSSDPERPEAAYYITQTGNVSISWQMDAPVQPGLYALYVLDKREKSVGSHAFSVLLDDIQVTPYRGQADVIFGDDRQKEDEWLSLGFYQLESWQILRVEAQIGTLSDQTPFALDRLLLVKVSDDQRPIIDALPGGRVLAAFLDDERATFIAKYNEKPLVDQGANYADVLAWKNDFTSLNLSGDLWVPATIGHDVWVDWSPLGKLQPGDYELFVWIPAEHATAIGEFSLLSNGRLVQRDTQAPIDMQAVSGQWKSMGIWNIPKESAVGVRLSVKKAEQLDGHGEIGVDAVVLVRVE